MTIFEILLLIPVWIIALAHLFPLFGGRRVP